MPVSLRRQPSAAASGVEVMAGLTARAVLRASVALREAGRTVVAEPASVARARVTRAP